MRSNITLETLQAIKSIVQAHGPEFDAEDLDPTKSVLLRANARAFESPGAELGLLGDMSQYGFPADYVIQREQIVRDMTIERIRQRASQYLAPDRRVWLVVGDARTQLSRLAALGLGRPTVLTQGAAAR